MGNISKATIQKSVIALSATACILMGQNCGHKMEFADVSAGMPSMKEGAGIVTTMEPLPSDSLPSNHSPSVTDGNDVAGPTASTTDTPSRPSDAEVSAPQQEQVTGTETSSSSQTSAPSESSPTEIAGPDESSTGGDACMDVANIEEEDLKRVATLDDHGNVKTIAICHNEDHNPKNKVVNESALKGHLGHGDYIGTCGQPAVKSCQDKISSSGHESEKEERGKSEQHQG